MWIKDKHEVEKVDLYLQIKEKLVSIIVLFFFLFTVNIANYCPKNFGIQKVHLIQSVHIIF